MTKQNNTSEKLHAQSLGIAISQGSDFFNPQNSVYRQIYTLSKSFELSHINVKFFLKGEAVSLLQHADLKDRFQSHFNFNVELFACSTALERYQEKCPQPTLATYELAGLGFWVEEASIHPTLDFSTSAIMPKIIIATASPETPLFEEQLDLALATAAYDFEPLLLLQGAAQHIFDARFAGTAIGKKMASAEIYGISEVLYYEAGYHMLQEALNAAGNEHRIFQIQVTSLEKELISAEMNNQNRDVLYCCDRFICI